VPAERDAERGEERQRRDQDEHRFHDHKGFCTPRSARGLKSGEQAGVGDTMGPCSSI
jgi:hypothetical protein